MQLKEIDFEKDVVFSDGLRARWFSSTLTELSAMLQGHRPRFGYINEELETNARSAPFFVGDGTYSERIVKLFVRWL